MDYVVYRLCVDTNDGIDTNSVVLDFTEYEIANTVFGAFWYCETVTDCRFYTIVNGSIQDKIKDMDDEPDYEQKHY